MKSKVNPIPRNYHTVTPFIMAKGTARLLEFLKKAFDAKVVDLMKVPGGTVAHASVLIGNSMIMMGEAGGKWKRKS